MPDRPATGPRPARRTVLRAGLGASAGAVLWTTAACDLRFGSPGPRSAAPPAPDPSTDERALAAALERADGLVTEYGRAAVVRPDLADRLRQLAADHSAHARVLRPLAGRAATTPTSSVTASGSASPASSTSPATPASTPPSTSTSTPPSTALTAVTALSALAQLERGASSASLADLTALSGPAARLLASVAGCATAHVAVLATLPAARVATSTSTRSPS